MAVSWADLANSRNFKVRILAHKFYIALVTIAANRRKRQNKFLTFLYGGLSTCLKY